MNKLFLIIGIFISVPIQAQIWNFDQKIVASDRSIDSYFGTSISLDSTGVAISAMYNSPIFGQNDTIFGAGSVYFFENTESEEWYQTQKVSASTPDDYARFGISIAKHGNYAVVGADRENKDLGGDFSTEGAGAAYIFEKDFQGNWNEIQKIVASDREPEASFGWAIDMEDTTIIVSAYSEPKDEVGGDSLFSSGAVYVFEQSVNGSWNEVQKIVASDRNVGDEFGYSIGLSGDYLIIGAAYEQEDASGQNPLFGAGSAYIFERNGNQEWVEVQKIVASDRSGFDTYAYSVAIHEDYAVVGAIFNDFDELGQNYLHRSGSAYIYHRAENGVWIEVQKIVASDREEMESFGRTVMINDKYVLVGATSEDGFDINGVPIINRGATYIYEMDSSGVWVEIRKLLTPESGSYDYFGNSIGIQGNTLLIGAYHEREDENEENYMFRSGSVYSYSLSETTSISSIDKNNQIEIYPNPTSGMININLVDKNAASIIIRNLLGQKLYHKTNDFSNDVQIEIDGNSGLYIVEVRTKQGDFISKKVYKN